MGSNTEDVGRIAQAEKELCDRVGPLLEAAIADVARRNRIEIREVRVTMEQSHENHWVGANVVIVR